MIVDPSYGFRLEKPAMKNYFFKSGVMIGALVFGVVAICFGAANDRKDCPGGTFYVGCGGVENVDCDINWNYTPGTGSGKFMDYGVPCATFSLPGGCVDGGNEVDCSSGNGGYSTDEMAE